MAGLLFLLAAGWWRTTLLWEEPFVDESIYLGAVASITSGGSPYAAPRFVYNPPFAVLLAGSVARWGTTETLIGLRILGLAGGVLLIWGPLVAVGWPRRWSVPLAAALLLFSPIVTNNLTYGNVSFLVLSLALVGLAIGVRWPVGGALIGLSVGLKPMVAGALPAFALASSRFGLDLRRAGTVVVAGISAVALQAIGFQFLSGLWQHAGGLPTLSHNIALSRVLYCFGLEVPAIWLLVGISALAAAWLTFRRLTPVELVAVVAAVAVTALPSASLHTMAFTYPIQAVAIDRFWTRRKSGEIHWREGAWVLLAVVAIHSGHGMGSLAALPLPWQGLFMALPVLSPMALAWFVVERGAVVEVRAARGGAFGP